MYCKHMSVSKIIIGLILGVMLWTQGFLNDVLAHENIKSVRVWASPESTRVIFDLSKEVKYKLFTLENPNRVVIDFEETILKANLNKLNLSESRISKVRHSVQENGKVRVVLDMQNNVKPTSFLLAPNQEYGHRLVIDLNLLQPTLSKPVKKREPSPVTDHSNFSTREFIVAIDPGHGGDDTGAVGKEHQLKEKDVVLLVSKNLQAMINAQSGMRAFLIRSGDYYVGLRKRMELAREQGADLFISVHADSFKDSRATGASVYVLSEKGASNEASRWLAERENRSDLVGGVRLENKGDLLASVLIDLSQTASQSASHELAHHLVNSLGKVTDLHHKTVQRAGFMVLKSPDIPSVLVELGFISNRKGEENLSSKAHQQALATALLAGVQAYVAKRPKPIKHPEDSTFVKGREKSKHETLAKAKPISVNSRFKPKRERQTV